jgi:hypothetical protein
MPSKLIVLKNGQRVWLSDQKSSLVLKEPDGQVGRKVQGGLPPVPYRSATPKWASCPTKWAREPFQSKAIKLEVLAERKSGW